MTNPSTVGEDFTVNGTSLYTLAYNVWTLAGRENIPPVVGANVSIPYRDGEIWIPKTFDSRTLTLGMWVKGTDVNGNVPSQGTRAQFNTNLRTLKRLFTPRVQIPITRTLVFTTGTETHTGLGEFFNPSSAGFTSGGGGMGTDVMDLVPVTQSYGTFTIDLVMADPWWYGETQVTGTVSSSTPSIVVTNPGDVYNDHPVVTLTGPLSSGVMLSNTTSGMVPLNLWYNAAIASGSSVTVDCGAYTAFDNNGNSVVGNLLHSGSPKWMVAWAGANTFGISNYGGGSYGTGSIQVAFYPPYT